MAESKTKEPEIIECECKYLGPAGRTIHGRRSSCLGPKWELQIFGNPSLRAVQLSIAVLI